MLTVARPAHGRQQVARVPLGGARAWLTAALLGEQVWSWHEVEREGGDRVATLLAAYEGQTNGTAFTTGNSAANGDSAASAVTLNSGTAAYSTTQAAHGSASLSLTPSGTNTIFVVYDNGSTFTTGAFRVYVYLTGSPSATTDFPIRFVSSADSTLATIQMTTGRILRISAGSSVQGTVALALNTWHRIEVQFANITGGSGTIDCQSFTGDGTSATDSIGLTGLTLASAIQKVRVGRLATTAPTATSYFDDFGMVSGSATPIGPFDPDTNAAAENAAATGASNNATVTVATGAAVAAATSEALFDAANGSVSVTLTSQDAINILGVAHNATAAPSVVGLATEATSAGAALDATVSLGSTAGSAATAAANDATTTTSLGSESAGVAAAALDGSASIAPPATVAAVTAAAEDATVSRAGNPLADVAAAASAAQDATGKVSAATDAAAAGATANDAVVSTTGTANAVPTTADVIATALDAAPSTSQPGPADVAAGAGAAEDAVVSTSLTPSAENALAAAAAHDATVFIEGQTLAAADVAAATASAGTADAVTVSIPGADVTATATAHDATVLVSAAAVAEVATATALTEDVVPTSVAVANPAAEYGFGQGVAEDAFVDIALAAEVAEALAAALDQAVQGPPGFGTLTTGARRRPTLTAGSR